jgi:large subunit ribosomal protein L10
MATKERKREIVTELHKFFDNGKVAIVADVSGLTVKELTQFRRSLGKQNAKCRVAKNTLIKIATQSKDFEAIKSLAKGPSAIVIGYDDPAQPAKTTVDFFKALKKGSVRGGVLEGKAISQDDVKGLAELPSKDELLSSIMGGLDSGARGIASMLEAVIRDVALLIEEVAKKTQPAETPEADKPTEAAKPIEATEAAKPIEATEAAKPAEATEATKPTEATEETKPTEATEETKPTEATEETKPTEATEETKPAEPTEEAKPTE